MTIRTSVEIESWRHEFEGLPLELRKHFSEFERNVYQVGVGPVLDSLRSSGEPNILKACSVFDSKSPMRVYMEDIFTLPKIWFGIGDVNLKHEIRVAFGTIATPVCLLPPRYEQLLSGLDGVMSGTPYSPRLTAPKAFVEHKLTAQCWSIIHYANGDALVLKKDGSASFYSFSENTLTSVSFDGFFDSFLEELFGFQEW